MKRLTSIPSSGTFLVVYFYSIFACLFYFYSRLFFSNFYLFLFSLEVELESVETHNNFIQRLINIKDKKVNIFNSLTFTFLLNYGKACRNLRSITSHVMCSQDLPYFVM